MGTSFNHMEFLSLIALILNIQCPRRIYYKPGPVSRHAYTHTCQQHTAYIGPIPIPNGNLTPDGNQTPAGNQSSMGPMTWHLSKSGCIRWIYTNTTRAVVLNK